ncbi:MAG: transposase family protein [Blastocatellia bacterium]
MSERKTVTKLYAGRYQRATKREKAVILTEFLSLTKYNRCYGAWLLRHQGKRVTVSPQKIVEGDVSKSTPRVRSAYYDQAVKTALVKVWSLMDGVCSKRLAPALPKLIPKLESCGELKLKASVREKLMKLSSATIDRLLAEERAALGSGKKVGHTKPGGLLKHQIPIRTFADWNEQQPGFAELDLVGHEGGNARGDFCFTLDVTDVFSGWTETRGIQNKAQVWVVEALDRIRQGLPFSLQGIDSDNGSEFINEQLVRYCQQHRLTFTRSRSGRKNDNCFVEQKNYSVVRRAVGYRRYDTSEQLSLLNDLYDRLRLYTNYFLPVMKLREKTRTGSKVSKKYDKAQTPCERLLASDKLSELQKEHLREEYERLNPGQLKREIERFQEQLLKSVNQTDRTAKSRRVTTSSPTTARL